MDRDGIVARLATLHASVEAMRRMPPYEVLQWRIYRLPRAQLARLDGPLPGRGDNPPFLIPPALRPFYQVVARWELSWIYHEPSRLDGLLPMGQSFLTGPDDLYDVVDADAGDLTYGEGYHLFDIIDNEREVMLRFHRGSDQPTLYYRHVPSDTYHPLDLDVPTYIDLLLQCRALSPWQEFFITTRGFRIDDKTARAFFDSLARLFPDADPARFRHERRHNRTYA